MPFDIYPDAPTAALLGKQPDAPIVLAANEGMQAFVPLAVHAGPDPTLRGILTCFIRIAVSGPPVTPTMQPKFELLAHDPTESGGSPPSLIDPNTATSIVTAVPLSDDVTVGAGRAYFVPPFTDNVYLLKVAIEVDNIKLWIRITNTTGTGRNFVWVTADSDADTQQPWIHAAPATFAFDVSATQGGPPTNRTVGLANRGTGVVTVTDVRPAISAPYALSGLPLRLAPNADSSSAVTIAVSSPVSFVDLPPKVFSLVTADKPDPGPFGATGHNNQLTLSARTLVPNAWVTKSPMPTQRGYLGLAAGADGKLYAVGGQGVGNQGETEVYDPATDTWTSKAHLSTFRTQLALAAAPSGKVYAVGGAGVIGGPTMEEYDPSTDTWTVKAMMPTPRTFLGAAVANNGKIYAIGGSAVFTGSSQAVEAYDPTTNTWATMASMPTPRTELGVAVAANGKIYAVGGSGPPGIRATATLEEYDPRTNIWATKKPMPTARVLVAFAAASNGRLYAVGGIANDGTEVATVEEYDPATDTWSTTKTSMSIPRFGLAAAGAANGKIYAIGGFLDLPTTSDDDDDNTLVFNTLEQYTP